MFLDTPNVEVVKGEFGLLPKGVYRVIVAESVKKTTQDGTGAYISVRFEVIEGQYKGRKLWHRYNFVNKSEMAVKIAKSEMKKLLNAVGHTAPLQYEMDFHKAVSDRVLCLEVGIKKNKQKNEDENVIYDYYEDKPRAAPVVDNDPNSIPF